MQYSVRQKETIGTTIFLIRWNVMTLKWILMRIEYDYELNGIVISILRLVRMERNVIFFHGFFAFNIILRKQYAKIGEKWSEKVKSEVSEAQ